MSLLKALRGLASLAGIFLLSLADVSLGEVRPHEAQQLHDSGKFAYVVYVSSHNATSIWKVIVKDFPTRKDAETKARELNEKRPPSADYTYWPDERGGDEPAPSDYVDVSPPQLPPKLNLSPVKNAPLPANSVPRGPTESEPKSESKIDEVTGPPISQPENTYKAPPGVDWPPSSRSKAQPDNASRSKNYSAPKPPGPPPIRLGKRVRLPVDSKSIPPLSSLADAQANTQVFRLKKSSESEPTDSEMAPTDSPSTPSESQNPISDSTRPKLGDKFGYDDSRAKSPAEPRAPRNSAAFDSAVREFNAEVTNCKAELAALNRDQAQYDRDYASYQQRYPTVTGWAREFNSRPAGRKTQAEANRISAANLALEAEFLRLKQREQDLLSRQSKLQTREANLASKLQELKRMEADLGR